MEQKKKEKKATAKPLEAGRSLKHWRISFFMSECLANPNTSSTGPLVCSQREWKGVVPSVWANREVWSPSSNKSPKTSLFTVRRLRELKGNSVIWAGFLYTVCYFDIKGQSRRRCSFIILSYNIYLRPPPPHPLLYRAQLPIILLVDSCVFVIKVFQHVRFTFIVNTLDWERGCVWGITTLIYISCNAQCLKNEAITILIQRCFVPFIKKNNTQSFNM